MVSVVMKLVAWYCPWLLLQCQAMGRCPVGLVGLLLARIVLTVDQSGVSQRVRYSCVVRRAQELWVPALPGQNGILHHKFDIDDTSRVLLQIKSRFGSEGSRVQPAMCGLG